MALRHPLPTNAWNRGHESNSINFCLRKRVPGEEKKIMPMSCLARGLGIVPALYAALFRVKVPG